MPCRSFEKRIQDLLDDRLEPSFDSELLEHASTCDDCRDLLETQSELFEGLASLSVPSLSADFSQRVIGTFNTQRRQPAPRFALAAGFLVLIATLLLVVALGPQQRPPLGPTADVLVIASASSDPQVDGRDHQVDGSARGLSIPDFDSRDVRMAIEQFVAQLASGETARFYQVDQLAGTIGPLASTLNVAFDAIRRSIPRHREPPRSEPQARDLHGAAALQVI